MQDPAGDEPRQGRGAAADRRTCRWPQQQRVLFGLVGAGLLGLPHGHGAGARARPRAAATQVGATGQALMQSQRLAKSVSQALVGTPAAFPEVKESAEVLTPQRARPAPRRRQLRRSLPAAVQEAVDPLLPLVERAEKNAAVVLAQQKTLTAGRPGAARHQPPVRPTCWRPPKPCRR